jgi:hypothetical protein
MTIIMDRTSEAVSQPQLNVLYKSYPGAKEKKKKRVTLAMLSLQRNETQTKMALII